MSLRCLLVWLALTLFVPAQKGQADLPADGFLEPETPFLRSALVFEHEGSERSVRRGVIVPVGFKNRWACFDPDSLQWVVVWDAPEGKAPLTYDSMAGVSFPDKKAKAKKAPRLIGKTRYVFSEKYRPDFLKQMRAEWMGISLRGKQPILSYRIGTDIRHQFITHLHDEIFSLVTKSDTTISLPASSLPTEIVTFPFKGRRSSAPSSTPFPNRNEPATPAFPTLYSVKNPGPEEKAPFTIRPLNFPTESVRPVRATDIAFRKNGIAYLTTLDGDIWQIEDISQPVSRWTRIATGLFEPMAIEVDSKDRLFTLGRDQITELIDLNDDGFIDEFRNASDAFLQTLHTRDYATSLAIREDGSFLIAKGGLFEPEKKGIENELSEHRGTILHITPDGKKATVLADGLRLPYVGLRKDGTIFASDQQGHYIPSSPLHLITTNRPFLGFEPTNFERREPATPPLLWYPYQANRSSAAFCTTSAKAFPDLPETFLQASWNGRLFAVETPLKWKQPFSWQLPLQTDFPILNGATHPKSGRLYVTGLGISGYLPTTPKFVGLASIEQSQSFPTPVALQVNNNKVVVSFNRPLTKEENITPGNPTLRLFNIKRTPKYGSGHYLWNDEPGEHQLMPQSFALSKDRKKFVVFFDTLRRSDVFDLQLNISNATSTFPIHLYTHPNRLPEASKSELRELAQNQGDQPELQLGDSESGKQIFTKVGCVGCHSLDGQELTGPSLNGIAQRLNKDKLRESILDPAAEIAEGFEPAMPSFEGVIPPQDLEHLLSYLQTLQ
ncbi:MAG: c-type cytochrome [Roseibacillus sp.]